VQAVAGPAVGCAALARVAPHIFTTRTWRLGSTAPRGTHDGWAEVAAAIEVDSTRVARLHQVHGARAAVADAASASTRPAADILITTDAEIAVAVQAADCVPLVAADRRTGAVGAAHAGWRGLAARVPDALVDAMAREFGSAAADLIVAIGPSIGACCYEVGPEVRAAFAAAFGDRGLSRWFFDNPQPTSINPSMPGVAEARRPNHWFFDSWTAARDQLEDAGIPPAQIFAAQLCTASHPDLFCSYRRDGKPAGRMAAAIRRRRRGES
jgi:YfiH family protein